MRSLKKINRGLILTVIVLAAVVIFIVSTVVKVNQLNQDAAIVLDDFIAADSKYKVIPEEYRSDCDAYIKMIEPELRKFFTDDDVYNYYINNNIRSQFKASNFYKSYNASVQEMISTQYENHILTSDYYVSVSSSDGNPNGSSWTTCSFSFKVTDGKIKIYYINYNAAHSAAERPVYMNE